MGGGRFRLEGQFWKERHFRKVAELRDLENSHGCETTTATVCVENSRVVYGRLSVFRTRYERAAMLPTTASETAASAQLSLQSSLSFLS